ncbi:MAG: NACHT domain-containing protein [Oscillospiraceae bacterium]|jgi:WD40 repeat protein|nr:NACHT domain-containing protein [Oscillospiraceae bacterium]
MEKAGEHFKNKLDEIYLFCNEDLSKDSNPYKRIEEKLKENNIKLKLYCNESILDFLKLKQHKADVLNIIKTYFVFSNNPKILDENAILHKVSDFSYNSVETYKRSFDGVLVNIENIIPDIVPLLSKPLEGDDVECSNENLNYISPDSVSKKVEQAIESDEKPLLIVGGGGMGKTVTLVYLTRHYKKIYNENSEAKYIPFFFRLNTLNDKPITSDNLYDYIFDSFFKEGNNQKSFFEQEKDTFKQILHYGFEGKKILLLLDGLNEVEDKIYSQVERGLALFYETFHNIKIVITSRKGLSNNSHNFVKFITRRQKLLPYDIVKKQLLSYTEIGSKLYNSILEQFEDSENQRNDINGKAKKRSLDVLCNPMMLTIYTKIYFENENQPISNEFILPKNNGEILVHYYGWLYAKTENEFVRKRYIIDETEKCETAEQVAITQLTPYIAYKMGFEFAISPENFKKAIEDFGNEYHKFRLDFEQAIESLKNAKILTLSKERSENGYEFGHQHFRDFFAAKYYFNKIIEALNNKDKALDLLTKTFARDISRDVLRFLGVIANEHKRTPQLNEKTNKWYLPSFPERALNTEPSYIEKALAVFKEQKDDNFALAVKNLIAVSMICRSNNIDDSEDIFGGDLSGMDFSHLDLTKTRFTNFVCSRAGIYTGNETLSADFSYSSVVPETFLPSGHGSSIDKMLVIKSKDGCGSDSVYTFTGDAIILHNLYEGVAKKFYGGVATRIHYACFVGEEFIVTANEFGKDLKLWGRLSDDSVLFICNIKIDENAAIRSMFGRNNGFVVSFADGTIKYFITDNVESVEIKTKYTDNPIQELPYTLLFENTNPINEVSMILCNETVAKISESGENFYFINGFKLYNYKFVSNEYNQVCDLIDYCQKYIDDYNKKNDKKYTVEDFFIREFEVFPEDKIVVFVLYPWNKTKKESEGKTVIPEMFAVDIESEKRLDIICDDDFKNCGNKGTEKMARPYISKCKPNSRENEEGKKFLVDTSIGYVYEFIIDNDKIRYDRRYKTAENEISTNWQAEYLNYRNEVCVGAVSNNRTFKLFDKSAWLLEDYQGFYAGMRTFRKIKGTDGLFIVALYDNKISIWDKNLHSICSFKAHKDWCWSADANSKTHTAVSCSQEKINNIKEWDIITGREIKLNGIQYHSAKVETVCYNSNAKIILSGGHDGLVILHRLEEIENCSREVRSTVIYRAEEEINSNGELEQIKIGVAIFADNETIIVAEKGNNAPQLVELDFNGKVNYKYFDDNRKSGWYRSIQVCCREKYLISSGGNYEFGDKFNAEGLSVSSCLWKRYNENPNDGKPVLYFVNSRKNITIQYAMVTNKINERYYAFSLSAQGEIFMYELPDIDKIEENPIFLNSFYNIKLGGNLFHIETYGEIESNKFYLFITSLSGEVYRINFSEILVIWKKYNSNPTDKNNITKFSEECNTELKNSRERFIMSATNMSGFLSHRCNCIGINDESLQKYFKTYNCSKE